MSKTKFHTHTKEQAKLYFYIYRSLNFWIATWKTKDSAPNDKLGALTSQIYFWNKTVHVSDSSSVHHQELSTVNTAMVHVLTPCERDHFVTSRSCSQADSKPVWHIPVLCVQWKTPDDGRRDCPKHVEFYSENEFEKLVHLVGFNLRM